MKALAGRLERLERQFAPSRDYLLNPRDRLRLVVCDMDRSVNLEGSSCSRTLCPNGTLLEVVDLDGADADLCGEGLEQFVAEFPITILGGPRQ
jgi:hypothetical protein